jgi:hypothetical protein
MESDVGQTVERWFIYWVSSQSLVSDVICQCPFISGKKQLTMTESFIPG